MYKERNILTEENAINVALGVFLDDAVNKDEAIYFKALLKETPLISELKSVYDDIRPVDIKFFAYTVGLMLREIEIYMMTMLYPSMNEIAAHTLCFANNKGGVGKTTVATNVASCLSKQHKTLLIDLDPSGNASSVLGVRGYKGKKTIKHVLNNECDIQEVICANSDLHIIPGNTSLYTLDLLTEFILGTEITKNYKFGELKNLLSKLDYDFVVFDTPATRSVYTAMALINSEHVLIPVEPGVFEVEGVKILLDTVTRIPKLGVLGYIVNAYKSNETISNMTLNTIKESYGSNVFNTIIARKSVINQANVLGRLMGRGNKENKNAGGMFEQLTDEIVYRVNMHEKNKRELTAV